MPVDVGALVWVEAFGGRWPARVTHVWPFDGDVVVATLEFDGPRELRYRAAEAGWFGRWLDCQSHLVTPRDAETCPEQAGPTQPPPEPPPGR
jgi:hypothetical protein